MLFDPPLMGTKQSLSHQRPLSPHILVTKSSFDIAEICILFKALALAATLPKDPRRWSAPGATAHLHRAA